MLSVLSVAGLIAGCILYSKASIIQTPLQLPENGLIDELVKAEIIPTVIDEFKPFLSVNVSWKKARTKIGNTIKPKKLQHIPEISLVDELPNGIQSLSDGHNLPQLTLVLTDPDAPSRDNPEWSQFCHWIATNIPLSSAKAGFQTSGEIEEVMPYKPPGPPPKTGKHRYVFVALSPRNATTDRLFLSKPKDRKRWGYDDERQGLRDWAAENGLAVVGANFIYAQHKKQ